MDSYHTFKICGPSRTSTLTGRYPWGAGSYDMLRDNAATTTNFTLFPELLRNAGYKTAALGKWDVGWMLRNATPTYRGFGTFYGYYVACLSDYWYLTVPNGGAECLDGAYNASIQDWSDSVGTALSPGDRVGRNGTYNRNLLSGRAADIIRAHDAAAAPLFMYLAFQDAHEGCSRKDKLGVQAPLATVELYNTTELDTYKIQGAMLTELDYGVEEVVAALKASGMYDNTLCVPPHPLQQALRAPQNNHTLTHTDTLHPALRIVFISDNGGPIDHSTNAPLRGGKHTFWDGGLRVEAFLAGGLLPAGSRGSTWRGLAHASDWYPTLVTGVAGVPIDPAATGGPRPLDGLNLWPSILANNPSPRTEVIHQVNNSYFDEGVQALRVGDLKLIRGPPGDARTIAWPERSTRAVPLGRSGAVVEPGTDHVRGTTLSNGSGPPCAPFCLFNVSADPGEQHDLSGDASYRAAAAALLARLDEAGASGPPRNWIWQNASDFKRVSQGLCAQELQLGSVQPVDYAQT